MCIDFVVPLSFPRGEGKWAALGPELQFRNGRCQSKEKLGKVLVTK